MNQVEEQSQIIASWHKAFEQCTDFDLWGQPIEAIEGYRRLSKQLHNFASLQTDDNVFSDEQKKILGKIAICLDLRCKALQAPGTVEGILLDDLKRIGTTLQNVLNQRCKDFPVDVAAAQLHAQSFSLLRSSQNNDSNGVDKQIARVQGNLLPKPIPLGGMNLLMVRIEKIGLKDATQYIDPYISITVRDSAGTDLTASQDTPVAVFKEELCINFNDDVHIQKPLDSLPVGFAIFFEFKHFKPKKNFVSTKCWAFMEKDEIKEGPVVLELYKKPADYKRKNIKLLTVKPLYLHLKIIFNN